LVGNHSGLRFHDVIITLSTIGMVGAPGHAATRETKCSGKKVKREPLSAPRSSRSEFGEVPASDLSSEKLANLARDYVGIFI
jgi:hypothetical protein